MSQSGDSDIPHQKFQAEAIPSNEVKENTNHVPKCSVNKENKKVEVKNTETEHVYSKKNTVTPNPFKMFHESIAVAPNVECFSCKKLFYPSATLKTISLQTSPDLLATFDELNRDDKITLCSPCRNALTSKRVQAQCYLNNLDLPPVPDELKNLNSIEQRKISQVHAYMKLVLLPFGQSALNGQTINFPFDVDDILKQKPTFDAKSIVVVNKPGEALPTEFVADMKKVKDALLYLKHHNPHYANVSLNDLDTNLEPSIISMEKQEKKSESDGSQSKTLEEIPKQIETSMTTDVPFIPKIDFEKQVCGQK